MIEVDRLMTDEYGITLIQMMENAGRCLARLAVDRFLKKKLKPKRAIVLAGTGGNGGGALVRARRLHNWGTDVEIYLTATEDRLSDIPLHQLRILQRMGVNIRQASEQAERAPDADLIIDGIIGYSIKGAPRGNASLMIGWVNARQIPVLSLDTPSGLDLSSGVAAVPTVRATATLTLALPKQGLFSRDATKVVGELFLADIGVPPELYAKPGLGLQIDKRIFSEGDVLGI